MPERTRLERMRHDYSVQGWALLAYLGIMNFAVMLVAVLGTVYLTVKAVVNGAQPDAAALVNQILDFSGWGYLLAMAIGLVILLLWKKPKFCFATLWAKGRTMTIGRFLAILTVFMSAQLISQLGITAVELVLGLFGLSMEAYVQSINVSTDAVSMFLYVALGAPISEELLFRGLVLRSMEPHGKGFAIFGSALLFGLFHGNLIQAPFAFLVGLVLGYVALEYNIGWAMLLHMFNNLIVADTMPRLLAELPPAVSDLIFWIILAVFGAAAVIVLAVKWERVSEYVRRERMERLHWQAFFTAPGIIAVLIALGLSIALSFISVYAI